ncbi:MAG: phosphatidylinositol-3-phosphatase [Verrucomicrobiota bacterium]|jgi:hypothetical protein
MVSRVFVLATILWTALCLPALAQFVAFNEFAAGTGTHPNTTITGTSGSVGLRDTVTGAAVGVTVTVTSAGVVAGGVQAVPDHGTPASVVFDGFVDFSGTLNPGLEIDTAADFVTYTFSGLDPNSEYNFQGTAMRGNKLYTDRWSVFEITGAASFTPRHTPGTLTTAQVPALTSGQVAINTGNNIQGQMAWWEHIRPAAGGTFAITSRQYTGVVPGGVSNGTKGYGICGFRLQKTAVYAGRTNLPPRTPNLAPASINGIKTVFVILMENHDWNTILGSSFCPYINNTLLPQSAYCDGYRSPRGNHPSEPNYLWLIAGTNFNIRDDSPPSVNHQSSTSAIFYQLDAAGISWKTYQEDISGTVVPDVDSGQYGVRHNPFVFFDSVRNNLNYCTNHVRPYTELARDLTNNTVPRFCFITPNVTNDMHDLSPGSPSTRVQGDNWLAREVPKILASAAYANGAALFIIFDEGSSDGEGPIGMMVLSARIKAPGYHNATYYNHSSALRTFQDIFGVRPYLADAAYASNLGDLFKTISVSTPRWLTNSFRLNVTNTIAGRINYLQGTADLLSGTWSNLATNVATGTGATLTATNLGAFPHRFLRVVELP